MCASPFLCRCVFYPNTRLHCCFLLAGENPIHSGDGVHCAVSLLEVVCDAKALQSGVLDQEGLGNAASCYDFIYSWPISGVSSIELVFYTNISFLYFLSLSLCSHVSLLVFCNHVPSLEPSQCVGSSSPDNMWGQELESRKHCTLQ